jgi:hypothetical protein
VWLDRSLASNGLRPRRRGGRLAQRPQCATRCIAQRKFGAMGALAVQGRRVSRPSDAQGSISNIGG